MAKQTNNGLKGGILKGDKHSDPSGGIEAVVVTDNNKPVLLENSEVIINKKAVEDPTKKTLTGTNKEILNAINTSTGGKPILEDRGILGGIMPDKEKTFKERINVEQPTKPTKEVLASRLKLLKKMLEKNPSTTIKTRIKIVQKMLLEPEKYCCGGTIQPVIEMEKGGNIQPTEIPNNYVHTAPSDLWNNWTIEQKEHFLKDHTNKFSLRRYKRFINTNYHQLTQKIQVLVANHWKAGQYEKGGEILNADKDKVTFNDFHLDTFADFTKIKTKEIPQRNPDFISRSGSKYWYEGEYVIRESNHWGRTIASCNWLLNSCSHKGSSQGKCLLSDFERQNIDTLQVGKKYKIKKTALRRNGKGCIDIESKEGFYIKETGDYYIFDTFRVARQTLASVKLLRDGEILGNGGKIKVETVFTKDNVEVEKRSDKYKGHVFYDEQGNGYECLGYFPKLDDCVYVNLTTQQKVVGCMDGFYFNNPKK